MVGASGGDLVVVKRISASTGRNTDNKTNRSQRSIKIQIYAVENKTKWSCRCSRFVAVLLYFTIDTLYRAAQGQFTSPCIHIYFPFCVIPKLQGNSKDETLTCYGSKKCVSSSNNNFSFSLSALAAIPSSNPTNFYQGFKL